MTGHRHKQVRKRKQDHGPVIEYLQRYQGEA